MGPSLVGLILVACQAAAPGSTMAPVPATGSPPARATATAAAPSSPTTPIGSPTAAPTASLTADVATLPPLPEGGRVEATGEPQGAAQFGTVTHGAVWLPDADTGQVHRFDADTLAHLGTERVGPPGVFPPDAQGAAAGSHGVWVPLAGQQAVALLNSDSGEIERTIQLDGMPYSLVEAGTDLWIADYENSKVIRLDIESGEVIARLDVERPTGIAFGEDTVWATVHVGRRAEHEPIDTNGGRLARIDPGTNTVTALIEVGPRPYTVAVGFGSAWTSDATGGSVTRVDAVTNEVVATIDIGEDGAYDVEVAGDSVWAAASPQYWNEPCSDSGAILRIDPATNLVTGRNPLPCAGGLVSDGERLWAQGGTASGGILQLIEPLAR